MIHCFMLINFLVRSTTNIFDSNKVHTYVLYINPERSRLFSRRFWTYLGGNQLFLFSLSFILVISLYLVTHWITSEFRTQGSYREKHGLHLVTRSRLPLCENLGKSPILILRNQRTLYIGHSSLAHPQPTVWIVLFLMHAKSFAFLKVSPHGSKTKSFSTSFHSLRRFGEVFDRNSMMEHRVT